MLLFHLGKSFSGVQWKFCTPTASQPSPGNLMDMNHLLCICLAIFHQARDGKQLRKTPQWHISPQPGLPILQMVEMGILMVDYTALL